MTSGLQMSIKKVLTSIAMTVAWIVAILLGVLFTAAGLYGVKNASMVYEPVSATVALSTPQTRRGNADTASRSLWSSSIDIEYFYEIDGTSFNGRDRLDIGSDGSPSEASARVAAALDLYAPGNAIQVFVDPEDPAKSRLERKTALSGLPVLMMGMIFLTVTLGGGLLSLSRRSRRTFQKRTEDTSTEGRLHRWMDRALLILVGAMMVSGLAWGATKEPVTVAIVVGSVALFGGWILWDRRRAPRRKRGR